MNIIKNIQFLLVQTWKTSKSFFLITTAKNIFNAILPLVNIIGLGTVVNALMTNESYKKVITIIIIYLALNLGIAIIQEILTLFENNIMRVISNVMQFDYSRDSINVNYHYAQDGTVFNLRRKSMQAYPPYFLGVF